MNILVNDFAPAELWQVSLEADKFPLCVYKRVATLVEVPLKTVVLVSMWTITIFLSAAKYLKALSWFLNEVQLK